jgi:ParB family transcriptional regulator, chromosome partitioning protein
MTQRGLGKGLGALIPASTKANDFNDNAILDLNLEQIKPNKNQPRHNFYETTLNELAESIREFGIIQPIIVRKLDGESSYEIIAGERRFRAAQKIGLRSIPAIVNKDVDDTSSLAMALIENTHRENLSPIEKSITYKQLIEDFKITHEELANKIGKSRASITNSLRLLSLPLSIQKLIDEMKITEGHARGLISLKKIEDQLSLAEEIIKKDLSVREVERIANKKNSTLHEEKKEKRLQFSKLPMINEKVSDYLNAPVKISIGKKKGKIEIDFGTVKDLERIVDKIIGN